jgi:hypothetical protein
MKKKQLLFVLLTITVLLLSACTSEREKNNILITHTDNSEPTKYPADVEYQYMIKEGFKLPKENMLVTFKWHMTGSHNQEFWLYEVTKDEKGYSLLDNDYEGFYVKDLTKLGYSPVSEISNHEGTITVRVANETQYRKVIGKHPYTSGTHLFEELLVPDTK